MVNLLVRSTRVTTALAPALPMMRSPSLLFSQGEFMAVVVSCSPVVMGMAEIALPH